MKGLDGRDDCLRAFLYAWALQTQTGRGPVEKDRYDFFKKDSLEQVIKDCRLDKCIGHRKSVVYRWSNSGSANPSENTLFNRPTKWLYDKVLRHFNIDPYKGLNGDQYRAYFLWLYKNRKDSQAKSLARKVLFGFIIRLGLTPSLCEWAPLKPQAYVLLLKMFWYLYPLYLIARVAFYFSVEAELKVPVEVSTTNKITMIPTMISLGQEFPCPTVIKETYETYFKPGTDVAFIGEACIAALTHRS
jgi:hypothetical protein